jgi:GH25 family lysozyme M1 (1,4-beta-N-acetylmuramidase)
MHRNVIESLESRVLMARTAGIDVSHWQGTINWSSVAAAGKQFAFQKATEGTTYVDPTVGTNTSGAKNAGLLVGVYHFAHPDTNTAAAEAQHFLGAAASYITNGFLHPVLDLEDGSTIGKTALSQWVNDWCATVKGAIGVDPIIYCNTNYATNYLDSTVISHPLWIANWSTSYGDPSTTGSPPAGVWGTGGWDFWQYSSTGSVSGISGNVDLDVFDGDRTTLQQTFVIGAQPVMPAEVTVTQGGTSITDGQATAISFGTVTQGGATASRSFTVKNDGGSTLTLGALSIPSGYTITDNLVTSLAPGASDIFTLRLDTAASGTKSGPVSFATNDGDENPFNFSITGTVNPAPQPATISGSVFNDTNGNGSRDTGEGGLSGWTVFIDLDNDGRLDKNETRVSTDTQGNWSFTNLAAGTYKVAIVSKKFYAATTPTSYSFTVSLGTNVTGTLFGERRTR